MSTVTETLKSPKKLHCAWTGGVGAGGRPPLKSVTFLSEESKAGGGKKSRGPSLHKREGVGEDADKPSMPLDPCSTCATDGRTQREGKLAPHLLAGLRVIPGEM